MSGHRVLQALAASRLAPFAGAALLAFLLIAVSDEVAWGTFWLAALLALLVLPLGVALANAPPWTRVLPPLLFLVAVAVLRDAGGGTRSGASIVALLPVFWVALYGDRTQLAVTVAGMGLVLAVPVWIAGEPDYPASNLRTAVLSVVVAGFVGAKLQQLTKDGRGREKALREAARARERMVAELRRASITDPLTDVGNRRAWDTWLADALHRSPSRLAGPTIALLDLDHFKAYNDTFGHPEGDELLESATRAWQAALRPTDRLARIGGEEFAVLLAGSDRVEAAVGVVERLRTATPGGQTCSVGIAAWDGAEEADALMRRADEALYAAKAAGRDRVHVAGQPVRSTDG